MYRRILLASALAGTLAVGLVVAPAASANNSWSVSIGAPGFAVSAGSPVYYGYGPQYYNGMDPKDDVSFYAPLTQHPAFTPNVIYFGSNRVYRSPDPQPTLALTPSWTAVSPKLTKGAPGNYLSWIGVLPNLVAGREVLYTGASDGRISVSSTVSGSGDR